MNGSFGANRDTGSKVTGELGSVGGGKKADLPEAAPPKSAEQT